MSSAGRLAVVVEADGGSRGNPGPAGYGAVVFAADGRTVLAERKEAIGIATNNVAEYRGLIAGLRAAAELGAAEVQVRMDSKLVVEQLAGRWQVKHPAMVPLNRQAVQLARGFERIGYQWIPRAQNSHADRLANEAMDGAAAPVRSGAVEFEAGGFEAGGSGAVPAASEPANNNSAWVISNATPTRFVLVRHGVTEYSLAKRFAGRSDLALTALGAEQAEQAANRVAALGPVDALVCSPLLRTRQTASALSERLGIEPVLDEGMIELDYGDWDGYTFDEIRQSSPDELRRWLADPAVAPPAGESLTQLTRRVRRSRDRLLAKHQGKTVVVVTHVSPIKCLVQLALDAPPAAVHRMFLAPASVSVIDYFADGPVSLRSYNDTAHLSEG